MLTKEISPAKLPSLDSTLNTMTQGPSLCRTTRHTVYRYWLQKDEQGKTVGAVISSYCYSIFFSCKLLVSYIYRIVIASTWKWRHLEWYRGKQKAGSCQKLNSRHLAWAASDPPLSYDNQTTTSPHILHRWYWMAQLHSCILRPDLLWGLARQCHQNNQWCAL